MSGATSTDDLTSEVKKHTRGVLLSKIGGVPLAQFEKDYRELLGKKFPFRELGFSDAQSCLQSLTDTVRFEFSQALEELTLFGIADDHSFMSSPAIKAQFTPDKPINQRKKARNKKYPKKSSDSDDSKSKNAAHKSKAFQRREKQSRPVNGSNSTNTETSSALELEPNLKGLYTLCLTRLDKDLETEVQELFSEVASPEESSRGGAHFFLRYKTREEAEDIMVRFDNYQLKGSTLMVKPAKEKMSQRESTHSHSSKPKESQTMNSRRSASPQLDKHDYKVKTNGREGKLGSRKPHQSAKSDGKADRPRISPGNKNSREIPQAGDDVKQLLQGNDISSRLPWKHSQPNGDVFGTHEGKPDVLLDNVLQQLDALSSSQTMEPVRSSEPTDSISHRVIPKPRLPSILDLADRFKGNTNVK